MRFLTKLELVYSLTKNMTSGIFLVKEVLDIQEQCFFVCFKMKNFVLTSFKISEKSSISNSNRHVTVYMFELHVVDQIEVCTVDKESFRFSMMKKIPEINKNIYCFKSLFKISL